jgi:predicted short-subunit dehydrogenase-like oxidoreductase (DUF2520 family)
MNPSNRQIAVIGAGKLGVALAQLLATSGYQVTIGTRNPAKKAKALQSWLLKGSNITSVVSRKEAVQQADLSLLTVTDHAVSDTCDCLALEFKSGSIVAHCSGVLDSTALSSAAQQGCQVASLHPLNTFPSIEAAMELFKDQQHDTSLYCEGDIDALQVSAEVFTQSGFKVVTIDRSAKPLYHAAGVFACNYLTSLMELSLQSAQAAHLEPQSFWKALQPMITTTLSNISDNGTAAALSGPISRGDVATVAKHLAALKPQNAELSRCYAVLGQQTLLLAESHGELEKEEIIALRELLQQYSG